ncbi:MAG: hypothetical protein ACRDPY_37500 [Streptosporangiaceae bacterium]
MTSTDEDVPGLLEVLVQVRDRARGAAAGSGWCSCWRSRWRACWPARRASGRSAARPLTCPQDMLARLGGRPRPAAAAHYRAPAIVAQREADPDAPAGLDAAAPDMLVGGRRSFTASSWRAWRHLDS